MVKTKQYWIILYFLPTSQLYLAQDLFTKKPHLNLVTFLKICDYRLSLKAKSHHERELSILDGQHI